MMEQENLDIYNLVENELIREGIWFTQKSDPTYKDAKSYYKLDKYGDPDEKTKNKIAEEVKSLIGDGAGDIPEAIEVWKNDQMIEARLDFKTNLVTKFEPKPVVDNIEAYENPVQFPSSKKLESKSKKEEGAGAGYNIGGIIKNVNVISFNVDKDYLENNEHFGNLPERYFVLTCDIEADVEDCEFASYEYGSKLDFPTEVKITNLVLIDQNYDEGDDEHTEVDKDTIEEALEGATFNEVIGGGYVHTTFSGSFEATLDGSVYSDLYADNCNIEFLNTEVVNFIDKKVAGDLDDTTYCVLDAEDNAIEDFENEEDAIEFAKKNGYVEVIEKYHDYKLISADGSIDDDLYETGDTVWERDYTKNYKFDDEVEESKGVKTEASEYVSKYDEIDSMIDLLVSTPQEKVWLYNTFNPEAPIEKYDETTEDLFREWLDKAKVENYEELRKYLDEQQAELDAYADELFGEDEVKESKDTKIEDYDVDTYNKEQEELKNQYKDRIMKSATPEIINAFNDLNDLLNSGDNVKELDGFYFPEKAITVVELADKSYHLNSAMDLTTSNILNMAGNNDTFEQAIDELFADYDAESAYSWADNFITVLGKLDFDVQEDDTDYEDLDESKEKKTELIDPFSGSFDIDKEADAFAKDVASQNKELAKKWVNKYINKYNANLSDDIITKVIKQLDDNYDLMFMSDTEIYNAICDICSNTVNFNNCTKDKKIEAITDNFYSAFDSHGFRRRIDKDTTIEELMNELYNFIEFENISEDDTRKAIKDIVSHLNMQLKANLDELSIYLWYINGNYGGTYEKVRKNKITEDYQKRLQEVNNKSANVITDAMQDPNFDAESNSGKIILRTQRLFTALSDKGLDVDVTLDNGESTNTIQLGTAGGKIVITITDDVKPLQAFIAGNVEINDDIINGFQQIADCIKSI